MGPFPSSASGSGRQGSIRLPFAALRHRDYRLFWLGLLASVLGYQMAQLGMAWLAYELTGRPRTLALLGLATAGPAILLNLVGGTVADRWDRRRLIVLTQSAMLLLMGVLAVLTLTGRLAVWHLLTLAAGVSAVFAFDGPARQALYPRLLPRTDLTSGVALNASVWQGMRVVGPALGGVLIARAHPGWLFAGAGLGALLMGLAVLLIRPLPPEKGVRQSAWREITEGVRFVRGNSLFAFLIGMAFCNSLFGLSYFFLLPVFARDVLGVGAEGLGYLSAVGGVGSLLATLGSGALGNIPARGKVLIGGAVAFGLLLIAFAVSPWYPLSLVLLFLAGVAGAVYMVLTLSTLQERVPDRLRGRVMGIFSMTWSMIPLGAVQSGLLADWVSAPFAVALGGVLTVVFALVPAVVSPTLWHLRPLGAEPAPMPASAKR
ncbi:MAG: MFS transporter [Dehalococcoidia bacterium]|nr:MFS transporter [Dehalococcoidia bacterium]MDW8119473.1 MFS transporter [Chloroflexota bacterium]